MVHHLNKLAFPPKSYTIQKLNISVKWQKCNQLNKRILGSGMSYKQHDEKQDAILSYISITEAHELRTHSVVDG